MINRGTADSKLHTASSTVEKIAVALEFCACSEQPTGTGPYSLSLGNAAQAENVRKVLAQMGLAGTRSGSSITGIS